MKITRLAVYITVLLTLMSGFPGCFGATSFEQVSICTEVDKDGAPVTQVSVLPPDAVNIFCSVKLVSVSDKSKVKAEWVVTKSDDGQYNDYLIGNESIAASTPYIVFGFVRADKLFPTGNYVVKLYHDDKFIQSVPFQVKGEAAVSNAVLSDAVMCSSLDLITGKPLDKHDVFPNDSSVLICSARITGATFGTVIKAKWVYLDGELAGVKNREIYTSSIKAEGREYISFSIGPAEGKSFPVGNYAVTLITGDKEQANLKFKVVDWAAIQGPYLSEAVTFAYKDEEKTKIEITAKFVSTIKEVGVKVRTYNMPAGTELTVKWILSRSDDAIYADYLVKEDKIGVENSVPFVATLKRGDNELPKGDYLVKIAVNGKDTVTLPFRVQ